MSRLIDGDALIAKLGIGHDCSVCEKNDTPYCRWNPNAVDVCEAISDAPTIDAPTIAPERKTGKWIQKDLKWECDQCGCRIRRAKPFSGNVWNYYYCPNCGVKMEEGEQDGQTN